MVHAVQMGKRTRMSFSKIEEVLEMPNLIEVQIKSYKWFLEEGLKDAVMSIFLFQAFEQPPATIALGLHQKAVAS